MDEEVDCCGVAIAGPQSELLAYNSSTSACTSQTRKADHGDACGRQCSSSRSIPSVRTPRRGGTRPLPNRSALPSSLSLSLRRVAPIHSGCRRRILREGSGVPPAASAFGRDWLCHAAGFDVLEIHASHGSNRQQSTEQQRGGQRFGHPDACLKRHLRLLGIRGPGSERRL